MIRKLLGALLTLLAISAAWAPPAAAAYSPEDGAIFNDPIGNFASPLRLMRHVEATIDSTPIGATILISTYLLDRKVTVDKLLKAAAPVVDGGRGNHVQVVMDKGIDTPQSRRLMRVLNADNDTPLPETNELSRAGPDGSFAYKCIDSCRGGGGNNHSKFYAFSQAGASSNIVMISSANLNRGGAYLGYNDLFTMANNKGIYDKFAVIHNEMRDDTDKDGDAYTVLSSGRFEVRFFPMRNATRLTDPVMVDLGEIRCRGATDGAGRGGRTAINISMFFWSDERGMYIVDRLLQLQKAGCIVSVIYGAPSNEVAAVLRHAAWQGLINLYDTRVDRNGDGQVDLRGHSKYLLINGNYRGDTSAWQVYTGSQNWTNGALTRADEVMLGIESRPAYATYMTNWNDVRRTGARKIGD
ncbi:MAG: phospholipase D-like domain-containing protein [Nocardioidaceae bacterium]